jgi:hypothetical protein
MRFFINILLIFVLHNVILAGNNDKIKSVVKNVSGKITTANGEEIAGVKITVKETNEIFFADMDGNYNIKLKTDKVYSVFIESIGFAPLEVKSTDLNLFSDISLQQL